MYRPAEWTALKQFLDRGRRNESMSAELGLAKNAVRMYIRIQCRMVL
ncbi:MAG: hypothetical protein CM15mV52_0900 [uncultured marine virus]|nr:MAG: hypothetical protein CM15mV52_0900 [uncultured marine virus]